MPRSLHLTFRLHKTSFNFTSEVVFSSSEVVVFISEENFPPSYCFLARVRARHYMKVVFFAFTAFTEGCKPLRIGELSVKAKFVKAVKEKPSFAFTRNPLFFCDLLPLVKA